MPEILHPVQYRLAAMILLSRTRAHVHMASSWSAHKTKTSTFISPESSLKGFETLFCKCRIFDKVSPACFIFDKFILAGIFILVNADMLLYNKKLVIF